MYIMVRGLYFYQRMNVHEISLLMLIQNKFKFCLYLLKQYILLLQQILLTNPFTILVEDTLNK